MDSVIKAVIFMPEEERNNITMINRCFGTIAQRGYVFDSIVSDWDTLMSMLRENKVHVVVYGSPEHIDPTWLPRFELATEEEATPTAPDETAEGVPPSRSTSRRSRRPKRIR